MTAHPVHVLPIGDAIEHRDGIDCPCRPRVERCGNGILIIHNAADGREVTEELRHAQHFMDSPGRPPAAQS